MIFPTSLHLSIWLGLAVLGLVAGLAPGFDALWYGAAGLVCGIGLIDALIGLRRPALSLERAVHHNLPVTAWSRVTLKTVSSENRRLALTLHDRCDPDFQVRDQPLAFSLNPNSSGTAEYRLFPTRRGPYTLPGADVMVASPLHLWRKKWFLPCTDHIKVFPNFREISHFALLASHNRLSRIGIRKLARRGEGQEFHQLREYREGDELPQIDWKATSRYRRLISKDYQDERDQQVIFVVDSGRRMRHVEGGKSHLDQALNAVLLLAHVAARQGDSVGLYSFGGTEKWLPPRKQDNSVRSLLLTMYDIQSSTDTSDYLRATRDLLALQSRRSLMVVITGSRGEDHGDLLQMVRQLRGNHLVVVADLNETILAATLKAPIAGFTEAVRYQALQHYLAERRVLMKQLQHLGVFALDVTAEQLPAAMVNTYLEIKGKGSL